MKTKYWYWIWKTFLGPSRLRRKFVKSFLIAGLIPLILMGSVSFYLVNLVHRVDVNTLEQNLARQVSIEISKSLNEVIAIIDLIVTYEEIAPIAFNQQEFILGDYLSEDPSISEAAFICTTADQCTFGQETQRLIRTGDTVQIASELRDKSEAPYFLAALEINPLNGSGGGKSLTSSDVAQYVSPITIEGDEIFVHVTAPVLNKLSKTVAVLSSKIQLGVILNDIVSTARLGETGYVYVINADGTILSHPDEELVGKIITALPPIKSPSERGEAFLLGAPSAPYESINGETVSGFGALLSDLGIIAIAEWPRAETQELVRTILWQIIGFFLFAIVILAGIASWVAFKLIQPIAELRQGTSVIGAGNFDYKVNIKTGDEIEDLGKNLNKMAENLKGLREVQELKLRTELLSENLRKEQELSKLKDQFITTVSHQFNTPLSVINWAVEALGDPKLPKAKLKENAAVIAKSQKDISAIVNDLVTLSDIGFKYEKTKTAPVDITKLIKKSLNYLKSASDLKRITINYKKSVDNTTVKLNEFIMGKALDNLIDNAIAYSDEGGVIEIEIGGTAKEVTLSVTDQGIGIPKGDQPFIFRQFFRAKNAIQKKNVGTGLGLFIVKTIIEGHKGKIWFDSEEGKGSTFHVSLPR